MPGVCYNCFRNIPRDGRCMFCGYDPASAAGKYRIALKPGTPLAGRYVIGRVLGQGGFGISYVALDSKTRSRVALKEYLPTDFVSRDGHSQLLDLISEDRREDFVYGKEQFLSEARTLAEFIGNEHIVSIHNSFEANGTAYFAMEFVEGVNLRQYMEQNGGPLPVHEANRILLPIMESLDWVHSKGIVHRDIAPDNVMIRGDGVAKLIDFGAARFSTGEKSKSLDVILKHGFAPFEQYSRRGRQGPFTDVYAMAATYYYAVTGKVPPDAVDRMAEDELLPPGSLGVKIRPDTERVLLKALSVRPSDRYPRMTDFYNALLETMPYPFDPDAGSAESAGGQNTADPFRTVAAAGDALFGVKSSDADRMFELGSRYENGLGVPQDYSQAMSWYLQAADQGHAEAMYRTGNLYYSGRGVTRDYTKAMDWYRKAADKGSADAMNDIGYLYENGLGVTTDLKKAAEWFRRAAENDSAMAMFNIGLYYRLGTGVARDYAKAMEWYRKAADRGRADAMNDIGFLYGTGSGVARDDRQALEWYRKAADKGHAMAMKNVGTYYRDGRGTSQDYGKAMECFRKAADNGYAEAMYCIGELYYNGQGVARDYAKAMQWYRKGADHGSSSAMCDIGYLYHKGEGVAQDYRQAMDWYRKAADKGVAQAMHNLGVLYRDGLGVSRNYDSALYWYGRAVDAGRTKSRESIQALVRDGHVREADAARWLK